MTCRVKICGITNIDDALMACRHGADALGFVFYEKSPREVPPEVANAIVSQLPPLVTPVALFVDADVNGLARRHGHYMKGRGPSVKGKKTVTMTDIL